MPERSVLSVAAGSRGAAAGHSAPISSSRVTDRCLFRTRKASSALPSRPGSRPSTRVPPTSSRSSPRSWIVTGRLSLWFLANSPTTALVVVDMLNNYEHDDAEQLTKSVETIVDPVADLIERADKESTEIIYVNDNYGDWNS